MKVFLITLKAYGDYVIAANALRRIDSFSNRKPPRLVAGEHVRGLARALNLESATLFIGDATWNDVPAAFDMRKSGLVLGIKSLINLRRLLSAFPREYTFLFDFNGWRENIISGRNNIESLSMESGNIYVAYDRYLENLGFHLRMEDVVGNRKARSAVIVPGARLSSRVMPNDVVDKYSSVLKANSINSSVLVLEGDPIPRSFNSQLKVLPRDFNSLIREIAGADIVISADSLPGHIAEFLGVPVFISTPVPKQFWLPKSAFLTNGWSIFSDINPFGLWLKKFNI